MQITRFEEIIQPNDQIEARRVSLEALRGLVGNVYPNKFDRTKLSGVEDTISNLTQFEPVVKIVSEIKGELAKLAERERPPAELKDALNARLKDLGSVRISGRLTTPTRGNFVHLTDGINKLQIYAKKAALSLIKNDAERTLDEENGWAVWQLLDHGDFVGVEGYLFITNTGELSVHVEGLQFLAKAMLPMPDKMHGISDPELQRRYRYADLIASSLQIKAEPVASAGGASPVANGDGKSASDQPLTTPTHAGSSALTTREVFERRAKLISDLRRFLDNAGFIEVETPMLTPKATGAAARPFKTHHKALDIPLYARIAPELYLKRLLVGGFEKVYELNRNFRNEGLSQRHNPEFTMLEFYAAYMDVNGIMDFAEKLLKRAVRRSYGTLRVDCTARFYDFGKEWHIPFRINFGRFKRITMEEAIIRGLDWCPSLGGKKITVEWLSIPHLRKRLHFALTRLVQEGVMGSLRNLKLAEIVNKTEIILECRRAKRRAWQEAVTHFNESSPSSESEREYASDIMNLFELVGESSLIDPTFVTNYPKAVSPLSKASPDNPNTAERFELFINGMEVANGFSELNDPREQLDRFNDQRAQREGGDEEAMVLDEDYIRALAYGMPPAAGIGIGIDRLVMILTNKHSIRDVILFPHTRPETKEQSMGL